MRRSSPIFPATCWSFSRARASTVPQAVDAQVEQIRDFLEGKAEVPALVG